MTASIAKMKNGRSFILGAVFSDASQTLYAKGKGPVIQSFLPFLKGVERVKVKHMIVEGEDACVIASYDYVNPKGERMNQVNLR
jgi:hypothetical protein